MWEPKPCARCGREKPPGRGRKNCGSCRPVDPVKTCSVCKVSKNLDEFHRHIRMADGRHPRCKTCANAYCKARSTDPAVLERRRLWRERNQDKVKALTRRSDLKQRYGITVTVYAVMLAEQDGRCAACRRTDPGKGRRFFDVDHDHSTGAVRGLLCHPCNKAIGFAQDDPAVLRALAEFLERGRQWTTGLETSAALIGKNSRA
jgi:hypothetical protein